MLLNLLTFGGYYPFNKINQDYVDFSTPIINLDMAIVIKTKFNKDKIY